MPTRRTWSPLAGVDELAVILICSCHSVRRLTFRTHLLCPTGPLANAVRSAAAARTPSGHSALTPGDESLASVAAVCQRGAEPVSDRGTIGTRRERSRTSEPRLGRRCGGLALPLQRFAAKSRTCAPRPREAERKARQNAKNPRSASPMGSVDASGLAGRRLHNERTARSPSSTVQATPRADERQAFSPAARRLTQLAAASALGAAAAVGASSTSSIKLIGALSPRRRPILMMRV
jgi:hypothetical protein